jgi:hypothetical protein
MSFMNRMKNVNGLSELIRCSGQSHLLYPWLVNSGWLLTLNLSHTILFFNKIFQMMHLCNMTFELAYIFTYILTMYKVKLSIIKFVLII